MDFQMKMVNSTVLINSREYEHIPRKFKGGEKGR